MASRQTRRPVGGAQHGRVSGAGVAVDTYGGPVIDPTENVLALVDAESKYQNGMRDAEARRIDEAAAAETRRVNEAAAAETRRVDELAAQKSVFDLEMARVLRANVDEVKNDLQIELRSLNQFRWESGGKTTGRDDVWKYIFAAVAASGTVTGVITFLMRSH